MLIVRTPEKDRITAQELTSRLKSIEARCRGDDYIHGVSQNPRLQLEPVPIRADLKQGIIDEHRSGMLKIPRLPRNKRTFPGLSALELAKP